MTIVTTRKRWHLVSCDYFAIIPSCSHSTMLAKYAKTILQARLWIRDAQFYVQAARSIQPKFQPVRPRKEDHLKRWTRFFETFPVGPNRSIEFWTEISGNFGWMDRAQLVIITANVVISRCCLFKVYMCGARAARLFFLTRPIKFWIRGVAVAVDVIDRKAPSWLSTVAVVLVS